MAKGKKQKTKQKTSTNSLRPSRNIVPKAMARTRSDVGTWKNALAMASNIDTPKMFPYYNLLDDINLDAHLSSQIQNRKLKTLSANFSIKSQKEVTNDDLTKSLNTSVWFNEIIGHILDSIFFGFTLIELNLNHLKEDEETPKPIIDLLPRQNVIPKKGIIVKDYTEDKGMDFASSREYGTWLLSFGEKDNLGLLNKAIPHVLFSRFAQSCWSELCEIYGIPPRVMKTNTQDPNALRRAEQMMTDMGAAAWFIIDETENFEFANTSSSGNGEVYNGLINLCYNNISLLISGAVIGQDTKHGSKGKEQSSQDILQDLVVADQTMVEQYMNELVLPALYKIGILPEDNLALVFDQVEDIGELWTRTKDLLPFKQIDNEWIKNKFGVEVTGDKTESSQKLSLDFFD